MSVINDWSLINSQHMTGGYILSSRGLLYLTNLFKKHYLWVADSMTWTLQRENHCYGYFPWLIIQNGTSSDIQDESKTNAEYDKIRNIMTKYHDYYHL